MTPGASRDAQSRSENAKQCFPTDSSYYLEGLYSAVLPSLLALGFLSLVNDAVKEPYLDEVFHVGQAQAYLRNEWSRWDPKITTPPGLYLVSYLLQPILSDGSSQELSALRAVNLISSGILIPILLWSFLARNRIESPFKQASQEQAGAKLSLAEDLHVDEGSHRLSDILAAGNITLLPPLYFFASLYYTDPWSVSFTLLALYCSLEASWDESSNWRALLCVGISVPQLGVWIAISRDKALLLLLLSITFAALLQISRSKESRKILAFVLGVASLMFRQTNIFWIAVYPAALEAFAIVKRNAREDLASRSGSISDKVSHAYHTGQLHDPETREASIEDWVSLVLSLPVAAMKCIHPLSLALQPYMLLIFVFSGFVVWNGGVVLGDKTNHVATIHLAQMLYLWPYLAFFGAPILTPAVMTMLRSVVSPRSPRPDRNSYPWPRPILVLAALLVTLLIIHFNTQFHPFLLADNRHYIFYVFRYFILPHPLLKYLWAPIYLLCGYLCLQALASTPISWLIVWLGVSTLNLITAPLVEPRYFIMPYIMWRLKIAQNSKTPIMWLLLELAWLVAINCGTMYLFLRRPFQWPQEPGKLQRFMW